MWPSRSSVDKHMPDSFKALYPKTSVIPDCTEIYSQSPSSINLQSELFSHYKRTKTLKCLIAISPGGALTFVSSLHADSIPDEELTKRSGILDLLEPGDEVMVDKGFLIEDFLSEKDCSLVIPSFLSSRKQFSKRETELTQNIYL